MFSDFFAVCFDYIANEFSKSRYMSNGQLKCPLVVRTANGAGSRFGAQHSQSVENWAMMIPGLKVVAPSTPRDVIGLLAAAVRDPDPVIFDMGTAATNHGDLLHGGLGLEDGDHLEAAHARHVHVADHEVGRELQAAAEESQKIGEGLK